MSPGAQDPATRGPLQCPRLLHEYCVGPLGMLLPLLWRLSELPRDPRGTKTSAAPWSSWPGGEDLLPLQGGAAAGGLSPAGARASPGLPGAAPPAARVHQPEAASPRHGGPPSRTGLALQGAWMPRTRCTGSTQVWAHGPAPGHAAPDGTTQPSAHGLAGGTGAAGGCTGGPEFRGGGGGLESPGGKTG